jgi:hypothetical protein
LERQQTLIKHSANKACGEEVVRSVPTQRQSGRYVQVATYTSRALYSRERAVSAERTGGSVDHRVVLNKVLVNRNIHVRAWNQIPVVLMQYEPTKCVEALRPVHITRTRARARARARVTRYARE